MRHLRSTATKQIDYARLSTRQQSIDRQEAYLLTCGVRRDDLYVDQGIKGPRASRPCFGRALDALEEGDILVITTLARDAVTKGSPLQCQPKKTLSAPETIGACPETMVSRRHR